MFGALLSLAPFIGKALLGKTGAGALVGLGGGILGATPTITKWSQSKEGEEHVSGMKTPLEDPTFSAFRLALIPEFWEAMERAKQPVYGTAERARAIQQANDAYAQALSGVKESLGRMGVRGDLTSSVSMLEAARAGQVSDFLAALPKLERDAYLQSVGALLGQGMQWAGAAPVGWSELVDRFTKESAQGIQSGKQALLGSLLGNLLGGIGTGRLASLLG